MAARKKRKTGFWLLAYSLLLLWLLLGQRIYAGSVVIYERMNLTPLSTIRWSLHIHQLTSDTGQILHAWINFFGNILLFVPLGYLLPRTLRSMRKFLRFTLRIVLAVTAVELIQYFFWLGCCDIDDLILNLLGSMLGYLIWRIRSK